MKILSSWLSHFIKTLSAVHTNGLQSPSFQIWRGTRQGCPLSPLLFALTIEPLAEAVGVHNDIHGLTIGERQHKINLYADDALVVVTRPEKSIPSLIETFNMFSAFSGYRIKLSKSKVMPLGSLKQKPQVPSEFPFKWSPEGFVCLRMHITPIFDQMFKINFVPLFEHIRLDLERWRILPISWLGHVALLKMNILPRLLYPIQMVPIIFPHKAIKNLNGWFSLFRWAGRKPRLKIATLCLSSSKAGLDLPDIRKYQLCACLCIIADWVHNPASLWFDIEGSMSKFPLKTYYLWNTSIPWNWPVATHSQSPLSGLGRLSKD